MNDAEVRFEREDSEGLVAVGSYLSDAAKRFGVKFENECVPSANEHFCEIEIREGSSLLSTPTNAETEFIKTAGLSENWRLACHAKIERPGEIVVMTKEKKASAEEEKDQYEEYRKRFEDLPLDKKMSELIRLEAVALSETLNYVANSPYTLVDKIMDVMAGFGFKLEKEKKESAKPEEHRTNGHKSETSESGDAGSEAEKETKDV
jgi:ferredoxin